MSGADAVRPTRVPAVTSARGGTTPASAGPAPVSPRAGPPVLVLLLLGIAALTSLRSSLVVLAAVLFGALIALLLFRRDTTGWPATGGMALVAACVGVLCSGDAANVGWFGLCVLIGWSVLRSGVVPMLALAAVSLLGLLVQRVLVSDDAGWGAWMAGVLFTAVVAVLVHRQSELLEQLRVAQDGLADRARLEERNRISREIHDVVGHSLTVSLLHLGSARLALADDDPGQAHAALLEAERLGRRSLAEVRLAVGVMRSPDRLVQPLPGVDQIEELVDSVRRAGTPVDLELVGELGSITATCGLAAYRILQEALTNVARHATGSPTTVRIETDAVATRLQIDSAGAPESPRSDAVGVIGMQERAEALGGRLSAGPCGQGWRVEAVLPR